MKLKVKSPFALSNSYEMISCERNLFFYHHGIVAQISLCLNFLMSVEYLSDPRFQILDRDGSDDRIFLQFPSQKLCQ